MKMLKFHKFDEIYEVPYGDSYNDFKTATFIPSGDFYTLLEIPGKSPGCIFTAPKGFDLESASTGIFIDTPIGPRELINGTELVYRKSPGTISINTTADANIQRDSNLWEGYITKPEYVNKVGFYIFSHIWLKTNGQTTPWESYRESKVFENGIFSVLTPTDYISGGLSNYLRIGHGGRVVEKNGVSYKELASYDIVVDGVNVYHQDPAESFPDYNYYIPKNFTNIEIKVRLTAKQL